MTLDDRRPIRILAEKTHFTEPPQKFEWSGGTKMEFDIAIQGYSRSFILQSIIQSATNCLSTYNNTGLISKVSEEVDTENAENCRCGQLHCRLTPIPRESPLISAYTLYLQKLESGGVRKTHLFCNKVRTGRSRSSKSARDTRFPAVLHISTR